MVTNWFISMVLKKSQMVIERESLQFINGYYLHKIFLLCVRSTDHRFKLHPIQLKVIRSAPFYHVSFKKKPYTFLTIFNYRSILNGYEHRMKINKDSHKYNSFCSTFIKLFTMFTYIYFIL